ncbi:Retinol dehydrogenase 5 [Mortierella sp. 14UC]|nr:Retinol dehydrogenase 5 [Mortierella sp. 14UC]
MTNYTLTDPKSLVVIITGSDSGFGKEIVDDLHKLDRYTIYATCLTSQAVEKFQAKDSTRLRAVQIDVTSQDDVNRLRAQIDAECPQGVYCVVNNAGILAGGYFDMSTEDAYQRVMDVNYMGVVRVTKALVPSLRAFAKSRHILAKGNSLPHARLIAVTSIAGRVSVPGMGPYSASKHAVESFHDTLRVELSPWEIDVSVIEPYFAKTPLMADAASGVERIWNKADDNVHRMFGDQFLERNREYKRQLYETGMPSEWVVRATVDAIHKEKGAQTPRILVGFLYVRVWVWIVEWFPTWVSDAMFRSDLKTSGAWPADPFLLKDDKHDEPAPTTI